MNFQKRFQSHYRSFLEPDDLQWLLGGVLFHTGLISANMPLFVLGIFFLPTQTKSYSRAVFSMTLASLSCVVLHFCCIHEAISQEHTNPLHLTMLMGVLWALVWLIWSAIYIYLRRDRYYLYPTIWIWISAFILEYMGIGFSHVSPMLIDTAWEPMIVWLGEGSVLLFIWLVHLLRTPLLRHGLWFVPILLSHYMPSSESPQVPFWLNEIHIFPEGVSGISSNVNQVQGKRMYQGNNVYYASIGSGAVEGISLKRHLVPLVESGYTSYHFSRMARYQEHLFLLLICNDALFSDIAEEVQDAEAIVVVSWLEGLQNSPLKGYFLKRLSYIHLKYKKPVRLVDADSIQDFPKPYRLLAQI